VAINNKMPAHLEMSLRKDNLLVELIELVKKGTLKKEKLFIEFMDSVKRKV